MALTISGVTIWAEVRGYRRMQKTKLSSKPAASYSPPTLKVYGTILELTASGTVPDKEGTGSGNRNRRD